MRALLLALVLAAPLASASLALPQGRTLEADAAPGAEVVFEAPVRIEREGLLYAKVLPTPGNAVADGTRVNGTGWSVAFSLLRPGEAPEEMGRFSDGAMSRLVPVREGEEVTMRISVRSPADAIEAGGARQRVVVALAFRDASTGAGGANGATQDSARALTLLLRFGGEPLLADGGEVPPVGPIEIFPEPGAPPASSRSAEAAMLPTWFLVALVLLLSALVAVGVVVALTLRGILAHLRASGRSVRVPVNVQRERAVEEPPEGR